jgi:hypothetical protein
MNDRPIEPEDEKVAILQGIAWGLIIDALILFALWMLWRAM